MADSIFKIFDVAMRSLLYTKFGSVMGINTLGSTTEGNINKGVVQCPKEIALRELAEKRSTGFLEFINYWRRGSGGIDWNRQNTRIARTGITIEGDTENDASIIRAVPVAVEYEVWFWSQSYNKIGLADTEYLFWAQENPQMNITLNDKYPLEFDMHFSDIYDESPIEEKYEVGQFFIHRMVITLDGWAFRSTDLGFGTISKILVRTHDSLNLMTETEVIPEDLDYDAEVAAIHRMFFMKLYGIYDVDMDANTFTVLGDFVSDFVSDLTFFVENSTGNNRDYTVVSSILSGTNTLITVSEIIEDSTVDGNIYIPE